MPQLSHAAENTSQWNGPTFKIRSLSASLTVAGLMLFSGRSLNLITGIQKDASARHYGIHHKERLKKDTEKRMAR